MVMHISWAKNSSWFFSRTNVLHKTFQFLDDWASCDTLLSIQGWKQIGKTWCSVAIFSSLNGIMNFYNQVKVPILAMKGGADLQTYVDILVPNNAKLTLIKVEY